MSKSFSSERFHALDATRAFALMLGVVFHAAWSFVPRHVGGPIVDPSGTIAFDWFFFTAHSFRMQVFFLIAGFFGRMLYHKRGWDGFARHRLLRVAVPFVVGWFILCPLVLALFTWGANTSGGYIPPLPIPVLWERLFAQGLLFVPRSSGGYFSLTHLWFLYYLLWIYLIAVAGRAVLTLLPESLGLRRLADRAAAHIAGSPWAIGWLTVVTGWFLWRMDGWNGVDTPTNTLAPSGPVILLYGSFFGLGWLWHRQPGLLQQLARPWKWRLPIGLAVSLGCFVAMIRLLDGGYVAGTLAVRYPNLTPNQIADGAKFIATLKSAEAGAAASPELANFWHHLPAPSRAAITALPADPRPDPINGACNAINSVLFNPAVFAAGPLPGASPAAPGASRIRAENRATLVRLLGGALHGNPVTQPGYATYKLVYSLGYALMMWLMAFATLGVFQALCTGHSAGWRYVADSAYWIYLVHLPLVVALQVWMAAWPVPALVKFPLLLGIAFAVLFASYHYLVRSTIIGQVLNGQRYPLTPSPLAVAATPSLGTPALATEKP